MNNKNIFFYLDNNRLCSQVYLLLKTNNLLQYFNCINVEDKNINIREVPAILIYNIKQIYYNTEIFNFIEKLISNKNLEINQQKEYNNRQNEEEDNEEKKEYITKQTKELKQNNKIIGYLDSEMSGFSDNYTFSDPKINISPQHTFVNTEDNIKIYTGNDDYKINKNDSVKIIDKLNSIRNNENIKIKTIQKDNQKNKINHDKINKLNENINNYVKKYQENLLNN